MFCRTRESLAAVNKMVGQTEVQWKGLTLEELSMSSRCPLYQVSILDYGGECVQTKYGSSRPHCPMKGRGSGTQRHVVGNLGSITQWVKGK